MIHLQCNYPNKHWEQHRHRDGSRAHPSFGRSVCRAEVMNELNIESFYDVILTWVSNKVAFILFTDDCKFLMIIVLFSLTHRGGMTATQESKGQFLWLQFSIHSSKHLKAVDIGFPHEKLIGTCTARRGRRSVYRHSTTTDNDKVSSIRGSLWRYLGVPLNWWWSIWL